MFLSGGKGGGGIANTQRFVIPPPKQIGREKQKERRNTEAVVSITASTTLRDCIPVFIIPFYPSPWL